MARDEEREEIAISFEVIAGDDGCSFALNVEASEPISYEDFLSAVGKFLEAEEFESSSQH